MSPDLVFQAAGMLAMAGWVALLASPWRPVLSQRIAAMVVPGAISVAYAGLILAFWSRAEGGFGSLEEVAKLFETRELLLAGWLHYLAFDLFVGAWIVRDAARRATPFLFVLPCLPLTFLFGPAGLLAYLGLRAARRSHSAAIA